MQKTIDRKKVWSRNPKFAPEGKYKVLAMDEVCVVNPVTKEEETHIVNSYKDEPVIDPRLREEDFSLEVQIKQGVQLKDCGKYFIPNTPEEYAAQIADICFTQETVWRKAHPDPTPDPTPDPILDHNLEPNPEPSK